MEDLEKENRKLKEENHNLKEQLENYIPRKRVRRVFKQLKKILEQDIVSSDKEDLEILKQFINKIEQDGKAEANIKIKTAIEHIIGKYEINSLNSNEN